MISTLLTLSLLFGEIICCTGCRRRRRRRSIENLWSAVRWICSPPLQSRARGDTWPPLLSAASWDPPPTAFESTTGDWWSGCTSHTSQQALACNPAPCPSLTRSFASLETSSHSGLTTWYCPSMIARSMTSCLRCQNGGNPTNLQRRRDHNEHLYIHSYGPCCHDNLHVYMMTPQAHL